MGRVSKQHTAAQALEDKIAYRQERINILTQLEDAWKSAVSECGALNRKSESRPGCSPEEEEIQKEAERKQREAEAIQQKAFLLFESLTEEKHEGQITKGQAILKVLSENQTLGEEQAVAFFTEEDAINRRFLQQFRITRQKIAKLLTACTEVETMPCRLPKANKQITTELVAIRDFIVNTQTMLG